MAKGFNQYNLPENWIWVDLGDILETTSGGTPSRSRPDYYNGTIPWVKSGELNYNIITKTEEQITDAALQSSSAKLFPKGTLLIALYGATVGRLAFLGIDASTNQAVCGIFQNSNINIKYIYYCLMNQYSYLISLSAGGAQPNISQTIIKKVNIPLPPLNEQNRIVDKLDELLSELEKGREVLQTSFEQLKVYRQSILKHAFEGKLTSYDVQNGKSSEKWNWKMISEVCKMKAGSFVKASEINENYIDGLYPCYGGNGLRGYVNSFTHEGTFPLVGRQGALCGNVHFVNGKFHATEHAVVVTPNDQVEVKWLYYKLISMRLNQYSAGAAQPGLSVNKLLPIKLAIPPKFEQKHIISELENKITFCDNLEETIKILLKQVDSLKQSLLHKAFEGKLVEQDPADEPAEKLLERIRAAKGNEMHEKKEKAKKKPTQKRKQKVVI